ncbi:MAG: response regulator [Candidatus Pristimantibacillus sp.]
MIKAIVVDDERLVRKGFISLIDWASFGIVIVGDAADGRSALELLELTNADLLFTDITMPGMSGFELIQQVRLRFPRVRSVVLTCHHEFDYVQEALRLGAIDYIVKTLLEPESADEVIKRIIERIGWETSNRPVMIHDSLQERIQASSALLFYPLNEKENINDLFQLLVVRRNSLLDIGQMWMLPLVQSVPETEMNREIAFLLNRRWHTAVITDIHDQLLEEVKINLNNNLAIELFYRVQSQEPLQLSYNELNPISAVKQEQQPAADALIEGKDLKWTLSSFYYDHFLQKVEQQRPAPSCVSLFGEGLCRSWSGLLLIGNEVDLLAAEIQTNRSWHDWKLWFRRFADHTQRRMMELGLSKEVMFCLISAVQYMSREASGKLTQAVVADYVKMSRSYFSQCFAKFAGEPFGVRLRGLRIERAKSLLLETDTPVYEIAFMVGFEDEKYFSKLFRDVVGRLPTEFRAVGVRTLTHNRSGSH